MEILMIPRYNYIYILGKLFPSIQLKTGGPPVLEPRGEDERSVNLEEV